MAAHQNVRLLMTLNDDHRLLRQEFDNMLEAVKTNEKRTKILYTQLELQTVRNKVLEQHVEFLEQVLDVSEAREDRDQPEGGAALQSDATSTSMVEIDSAVNASASTTEGTANDTEAETEKAGERSQQAADSNILKSVVNKAFVKLMGTKIDGKNLLANAEYPNITDLTLWPHTYGLDGARIDYLRFWWELTSDDELNKTNLQKVLLWIRVNGAGAVPGAAVELKAVFDEDLEQRLVLKFTYMRMKYREEEKKKLKAAAEALVTLQEEADQKAETTRQQQCSRTQSKLDARIRKRRGSSYEDMKFDAAFILNAMSDDDEDTMVSANEAKWYIHYRPSYRSDIAHKLYEEIDAHDDPNPDLAAKAVKRIRPNDPTEMKDIMPGVATSLKNRLCVWQIRPELLEQNLHWMGLKVATNGKVWGDDDDPVEVVSKRKAKEEVKAEKGKKHVRIVNLTVGDVEERLTEKLSALVGEDGVAALFA